MESFFSKIIIHLINTFPKYKIEKYRCPNMGKWGRQDYVEPGLGEATEFLTNPLCWLLYCTSVISSMDSAGNTSAMIYQKISGAYVADRQRCEFPLFNMIYM